MGISIPGNPDSPTPSILTIGPAGATAGFLPRPPAAGSDKTSTAGLPSVSTVGGDTADNPPENGSLGLSAGGGGGGVALVIVAVTCLVRLI